MPILDPDKEVKVDDREPPDTLAFVKRLYPSAIRKRIDVFDIQYKNVGFEFKTWGDLIVALTDKKENRFRNQLWNIFETLKQNPDLDAYYFIFGDWSEINEYSDISINAVLGAVASMQGRYGLRCNIFPNKEYAVYCACKIIEKTFDGKEPAPQTYRILTEERAKNVIYSSAERLSKTAVDSLCEIFGTPKAIINASVKQLTKANKVGDIIAERMYNTFNFDFKAKKEFEDEINEELKIESNSDILLDMNVDEIKSDDDIGVPNGDTLFGEPTEVVKEIQILKGERPKEDLNNNLDIEQDKVEEEIEEIEEIEEMFDDKDYDHKKDVIYKAIKLYNEKARKGCPFGNLLKASKYPESELRKMIRDLILESKVYECVNNEYEVYMNGKN